MHQKVKCVHYYKTQHDIVFYCVFMNRNIEKKTVKQCQTSMNKSNSYEQKMTIITE